MAAPNVTEILRSLDIFERLPEAELSKIAKLLKERKLGENQVLFRQGDVGDALYIITQGRIKISAVDQFGREKVLAFMGESQFFGDMALLTGAPRSGSATASVPTRLLQLRKDDFDVLLANNVEVMKEMLRVVAQRQAATAQRADQEASAEAGKSKGLLTIVFSPRGGSGRSTIAANLAIALAQTSPDRVALADLDVLFGHQTVMLNLTPRTFLAAATPSALKNMDRESFNYYLSSHEDSSLRVLIGASRPEEGEAVSGDHVRSGLDLLQRQFIHVLVDTGGNFSEATLGAVESADQVLMVVTPELLALRDIRECQRIFHDLLGYPVERFKYVLNHTLPYAGVPRAQIEEVLGVQMVAEIPYGGETPAIAARDGFPLITKWPSNPASKALSEIAHSLDRAARESLALTS